MFAGLLLVWSVVQSYKYGNGSVAVVLELLPFTVCGGSRSLLVLLCLFFWFCMYVVLVIFYLYCQVQIVD